MTLVYSVPAMADLRAIRAYLRTTQPERATPVLATLRAQIARLVTFPFLGRIGRRTGTRELVITGLPYLVVYRVRGDAIEVVRIRHTSQRQ